MSYDLEPMRLPDVLELLPGFVSGKEISLRAYRGVRGFGAAFITTFAREVLVDTWQGKKTWVTNGQDPPNFPDGENR